MSQGWNAALEEKHQAYCPAFSSCLPLFSPLVDTCLLKSLSNGNNGKSYGALVIAGREKKVFSQFSPAFQSSPESVESEPPAGIHKSDHFKRPG